MKLVKITLTNLFFCVTLKAQTPKPQVPLFPDFLKSQSGEVLEIVVKAKDEKKVKKICENLSQAFVRGRGPFGFGLVKETHCFVSSKQVSGSKKFACAVEAGFINK